MSKQSRIKVNPDAKLILSALLALFVFMSSAGYASALGITPGRTTMDFEPGLEKTVSFTIFNDEHKAFDAYVYIEGDLRDYITIDQDRFSFSESDNSKGFTYRVKLPQKLDPPGVLARMV